MTLTDWMDQRLYPGIDDNWDDAAFREVVLSRITPSVNAILDLGAGAGIVPHMNFRGLVERVCGVDPDLRVAENPFLDEGRVGFGEEIPYPDASFDLVFCDNVFEHLQRPLDVFSEVRRVLRPGGVFLAKTPNRWHYVPLIAAMTPHWFHQWVNEKRGRDSDDTFPTFYQANSPSDVRKLASQAGFTGARFRLIEGRPEYLRVNPVLYAVGAAYERIVSSVRVLEPFRVVLIAEILG